MINSLTKKIPSPKYEFKALLQTIKELLALKYMSAPLSNSKLASAVSSTARARGVLTYPLLLPTPYCT